MPSMTWIRRWRHRWNRLPVRWRLTAWYAALLGGAFVLFGAAVYIGLRVNFYLSLDEQVEDQTALVLATIQRQGDDLLLVPGETDPLETDEHFIRLLTLDGQTIVDTSGALGGVPLDQDLVAAALSGDTRLSSAQAGRYTIRVVTTPVMDDGDVLGVLQVGLSREEIDEALYAVALVLLISGPVVLAVAIAGGYILAGRAMAPVGMISGLAASIDADDLRARIDVDLPDDELGRLAATFNAMLGRMEGAFERQRRFTGDAAHELRTPLSLMRSQIDLALLHARSVDEYRVALGELRGDIDRLSGVAASLLTLARADTGQLTLSPASFDLATIAEIVVEQFTPQATEKGVTLDLVARPCPLVADEDLLVQVLVNLVANALTYTPAGGTVTVSCWRSANDAKLRVADTGTGIPLEHQARVFDRFYRLDRSRSRGRGGAGLGLSISRTIVAAHGGRIGLTSAPGEGTAIEVSLPAGPDYRLSPG